MCPRSGIARGRRHQQRWRIDRKRCRPGLGALASAGGESDVGWAVGAGARLFALAFTVNVTSVPEEDTLPEVEEGVSQFGTPEIE